MCVRPQITSHTVWGCGYLLEFVVSIFEFCVFVSCVWIGVKFLFIDITYILTYLFTSRIELIVRLNHEIFVLLRTSVGFCKFGYVMFI